MRTIKFRAWSEEFKKMYDVDTLVFNGDRVEFWENNSLTERGLDEIELMQFTGLLDKNGKEIYEGDILKIKGELAIVEWEQPTARYDYEGQYADLNGFIQFGRYALKGIHRGAKAMHEGNYEVLGNVMENPELLKS